MKRDIENKIRKAALLLFLRRHRYPGVREWELKKYLGEKYRDIINLLDERIKPLGFKVKSVKVNDAEYYAIVISSPIESKEFKSYGWRIDEMAVLAVTISYILSRGGSARREEIEEILEEKIPKWRIERGLERFVRMGYLEEEDTYIKLGVRSYIEFDLEKLISLLIGAKEDTITDTSQEERPSQP